MKEQYTTQVVVKGYGESKARALADALSRVQPQLLRDTTKVFLRVEPSDVQLIQAVEYAKKERFLFFFLPRQRKSYHVELAITLSVTAINVNEVMFSAQNLS